MAAKHLRTTVLTTLAALGIAASLGVPAHAASPSETLEKAIYNEQTVGNLDEAIKLYKQVIAEGDAARKAAAQAQYRLAMCYQKKGQPADAQATLEKLIKEYPEEKELIAKAYKDLPSGIKLQPAPWKDHEALQINMKLSGGLDIGTTIYMIDSDTLDGKAVWRCSTRTYSQASGAEGYSSVVVEKENMAPIKSRWNVPILGDVDAVYKPQVVEVKDLLKNSTRDIAIEGPVFDNEECTEMFRRLPLAVGYKTKIQIVATLGSGLIPFEFEVTGKETVETPAGKFECFKVFLPLVNQSFYYSNDEHRYLVQFEAGNVASELAKVMILEPGQTTPLETEDFTLTLPYHWFGYTPAAPGTNKNRVAYLLDADGIAAASVIATPRKDLEEYASAKAWNESALEKAKKSLKGFQLREGSPKEGQIAGKPSASYAADFTEGTQQKKVTYVAHVLDDKRGLTIRVKVDADKFDAFRAQLDKVIESLKLK